MTQEERLAICGTCTNRVFNSQRGIVCGLTNEKPVFENNCGDFVLDNIAKQNEERQENKIIEEKGNIITRSKFILFFLSFLFLLIGYIEGFMISGHVLLAGIIDWVISGLFLFFGFYSVVRPALGLTLALVFFGFLNLLLFIINPYTILSGIIWKGIIFYVIFIGIEPAQEEEKRRKVLDEKK